MKKTLFKKALFLLCLLLVGIVNANAQVQEQKYVKWKLVDISSLQEGDNQDVIVIVDLTTGMAMTNDKEDKDPGATEVELNYDKDRILGEVPENVQWKYSRYSDGYQFFTTTSNGETVTKNYLYADKNGLKVGKQAPIEGIGTETTNFTDHVYNGIHYLYASVADGDNAKEMLAGVDNSMFSNSWILKDLKDNGEPDDKVKDARVAIFKKVEDGQKIPNLHFESDNYEINMKVSIDNPYNHIYQLYEKAICEEGYTVLHSSSNTDIAYPVGEYWDQSDPTSDQLVLLKRGTIQLIARVGEVPGDHDKAVVACTVRISDTRTDKGTKNNPLTVAEAINLAKGVTVSGVTFDPNRSYFIKGKVNKVNSGMMAMFGDMGLDAIMGDDMDMEERMGDMDDFDLSEMGSMMGGMDITSMIPGFSKSDGLTYFISDDGTKDNRLKVVNGRGLVTLTQSVNDEYQQATFEELKDLSPGDDVLVYGPLELSEDKNMFSDLLGGIGGIGGIGQQSDYQWEETSLDELEDDDIVLLVDKNKNIALSSDVKSTTVRFKDGIIADNVSDKIKWTLTKNDDGTVTFQKDGNPLSVTSDFSLVVGQGVRSDFIYNSNLLGIEYSSSIGRYCIKWEQEDGGSALFENLNNEDHYNANFTFYKRVKKTEEEEEEEEEEDKRTVKVGELNYLHNLSKTLIVQDQHLYTGYEKKLPNDKDFFYTINPNPLIPVSGEIKTGQVKSADEEIAKWVINTENVDSTFTAVEDGKTKITVKVKVVVTADNPNTEDNEEKSYTMKRKFQLQVLPRDKEPEGKNVGEYVLVKDASELEDGTRLLIIGTRTKTDTENNTTTETKYALGANNSMMGGGKGGTKVDDDKFSTSEEEGVAGRECIKYNDVPEGVQEIILEQDENGWRLNVGKDENGSSLYLYATEKKQSEENTSGFNFDEMMEMFSPSTGLKVGTIADAEAEDDEDENIVYSLKANISISEDIATITFDGLSGKNTIMLASSFDMDSMMGMFGGMGGNNEEQDPDETNPDETNEEDSTFDMGSFDMFMASFNTKKSGDEIAQEGKDAKCFLPRIFGFVQYDEYPVNIVAEWMTIVSDYDVEPAQGVDAYVVTKVQTEDVEQSFATLKKVENLKSGEPYLLHADNGSYTMTRIENASEPKTNLLEISDNTTSGTVDASEVYVLAKKTEVGFYRWTGGVLGSGRVYLPVPAATTGTVREFVAFGEESTAIQDIESTESLTGFFYDLQGRRVNNPTNGIYIVNGKKAIIK